MYNGSSNYNRGSGYTTIGNFRIKTLYLYATLAVLGIVVVLFLASFLMQLISTPILIHFGMVAGVLLLIANLREVRSNSYTQHKASTLLNSLIGGALVCAWLAQALGLALFWLPALLLLGGSAPLALGNAALYLTYVRVAQNTLTSVRQLVRR